MYRNEHAWIRKKLSSGVSKNELRESVGVFSNKPKYKVMKEKNLNSRQYDKRNKFLSNVYYILSN